MWSQLASLASQVSETVAPVANEFREALREEPAEKSVDGSTIEKREEPQRSGRNWLTSVVNTVTEIREALAESDDEQIADEKGELLSPQEKSIDTSGEDEIDRQENLATINSSPASEEALLPRGAVAGTSGITTFENTDIDEDSRLNDLMTPEVTDAGEAVLPGSKPLKSIWGVVGSLKGAISEFQEALNENSDDDTIKSKKHSFEDVHIDTSDIDENDLTAEKITRTESLHREEALSGKQVPLDDEWEAESRARVGNQHLPIIENTGIDDDASDPPEPDRLISSRASEVVSNKEDSPGNSSYDMVSIGTVVNNVPSNAADDYEQQSDDIVLVEQGETALDSTMILGEEPAPAEAIEDAAKFTEVVSIQNVHEEATTEQCAVMASNILERNINEEVLNETQNMGESSPNPTSPGEANLIANQITTESADGSNEVTSSILPLSKPPTSTLETVPGEEEESSQPPRTRGSGGRRNNPRASAKVNNKASTQGQSQVSSKSHDDAFTGNDTPSPIPISNNTRGRGRGRRGSQQSRRKTGDALEGDVSPTLTRVVSNEVKDTVAQAASHYPSEAEKSEGALIPQHEPIKDERKDEELTTMNTASEVSESNTNSSVLSPSRPNQISDEASVLSELHSSPSNAELRTVTTAVDQEEVARIENGSSVNIADQQEMLKLQAQVQKLISENNRLNQVLQASTVETTKVKEEHQKKLEKELRLREEMIKAKLAEAEASYVKQIQKLETQLKDEAEKRASLELESSRGRSEFQSKVQSEAEKQLQLMRELDSLKEKVAQTTKSFERQKETNRAVVEKAYETEQALRQELEKSEAKVSAIAAELARMQAVSEQQMQEVQSELVKKDQELAEARKQVTKLKEFQQDLEFATQENAALRKKLDESDSSDKRELELALAEIARLQSETRQHSSVHLQRVQALEVELEANRSDVKSLSEENGILKNEVDKVKKALFRTTQELERAESVHRQKVVTLRAEIVKTKDEYEQLLATANEKHDELKQELMKLREELAAANAAIATHGAMSREAAASTSSSSRSSSLAEPNMIDLRIVNQLVMAFVKRGRDAGDNGRREVTETMSRIFHWTDAQKEEVMSSGFTSSSSASNVVSRGLDLLLSTSTTTGQQLKVNASGQMQETKQHAYKAKPLTTEAAAKLLEKDSFEHIFLNEFLAKEATSGNKRPISKAVESNPATPLSSRTLQRIDEKQSPSVTSDERNRSSLMQSFAVDQLSQSEEPHVQVAHENVGITPVATSSDELQPAKLSS